MDHYFYIYDSAVISQSNFRLTALSGLIRDGQNKKQCSLIRKNAKLGFEINFQLQSNKDYVNKNNRISAFLTLLQGIRLSFSARNLIRRNKQQNKPNLDPRFLKMKNSAMVQCLTTVFLKSPQQQLPIQKNPNRMQPSFKKIKSQSSIMVTSKDLSKEDVEAEYLQVRYENPSTHEKNILYVTPKLCLSPNEKLFNPQQWNLGRFEIGRPLGRGKFGHVYLARQKASKHIVAIKVLSIKQIVNSEVVGQVRRQIEIHTHLDHPNILKMYGFFFDSKKIYYIMEYAPGGELYKELKKYRKFDEKQVSKYIKQMTSALAYIHKCNVFHRDIKPENILICRDNQLKISDFGWSVRALTTQRKTMCGTMDYLCPEIIENKYYDWSVDIWALGVLTFELATGNAPFYNKDRQQQYKNIRNVNFTFPDYLSKEITDFISKLLQKNPLNRMKLDEALQHPFILMHN